LPPVSIPKWESQLATRIISSPGEGRGNGHPYVPNRLPLDSGLAPPRTGTVRVGEWAEQRGVGGSPGASSSLTRQPTRRGRGGTTWGMRSPGRHTARSERGACAWRRASSCPHV